MPGPLILKLSFTPTSSLSVTVVRVSHVFTLLVFSGCAIVYKQYSYAGVRHESSIFPLSLRYMPVSNHTVNLLLSCCECRCLSYLPEYLSTQIHVTIYFLLLLPLQADFQLFAVLRHPQYIRLLQTKLQLNNTCGERWSRGRAPDSQSKELWFNHTYRRFET